MNKVLWKCIKKISHKLSQNPNITQDSWVRYFRTLLNIQPENSNSHSDYIEGFLKVIEEISKDDGPLDHNINIEELQSVLQMANIGKAAVLDLINNQMLKFGGDTLHCTILYLFKTILKSEQYPNFWKKAL